MASSLKQMKGQIASGEIDLLVEVRDARIPSSSANTLLCTIMQSKSRVVVYNKCDLADSLHNEGLKQEGILLTNSSKNHAMPLLQAIKDKANQNLKHVNKVMVVGIPNVGKSTIINSLRSLALGPNRKKAVKTGALPGVTKCVSGLVKLEDSPKIYLLDTPGITMPKIINIEQGMKVALTGGLYDKQVGELLLSEYLLFTLNSSDPKQYMEFLRISSPISTLSEFLILMARRIGALKPGARLDLERAAKFSLKHFRAGKFGKFSLESVNEGRF